MPAKIRLMKESDVPDVVKIQEAITRRKVTKEFGKKVRSFVKKGGGLSLVADIGGRVAGYIIGNVKTWGFGVEESGWIEMVGVHPGHMGQGIGKKLGDALLKSFRAKDGSDEPPGSGRNGERNFHNETRTNETHASTTDPDAKLYRKSRDAAAKLSYIGHALAENRHGA